MATLHVALVEPEIHWNTGNTGRSCLAFGAQLHLIEPLGFSLEPHQVKRAGLEIFGLKDRELGNRRGDRQLYAFDRRKSALQAVG